MPDYSSKQVISKQMHAREKTKAYEMFTFDTENLPNPWIKRVTTKMHMSKL